MRVDAFSSLRIPNLVGDGRSSKLNRSLNFTVVPAPCHRKSRRWVLGCPWPIGYATPGTYLCVSRGFLRQRGLIMGCSTTLSPLSTDPFAGRLQKSTKSGIMLGCCLAAVASIARLWTRMPDRQEISISVSGFGPHYCCLPTLF
jgi:hypothetical protein